MPRLYSLFVAVAVIVAGIVTNLPLWREKAVQQRQLLQLEEELRQEQARTKEITDKITAVKSDPKTVERLAREKFGLGRSGEVIFKFRSDLPPQAAPRSLPGARSGFAR